MKMSDIIELTNEELMEKRRDLQIEYFNLRVQAATGQLENSAKMKSIRRDIARTNTVVRQRGLIGKNKKAETKKEKVGDKK